MDEEFTLARDGVDEIGGRKKAGEMRIRLSTSVSPQTLKSLSGERPGAIRLPSFLSDSARFRLSPPLFFGLAVDDPLDPHLGRAVSLGLVECGTDPASGESLYFISRLALPLVEKETTEEERTETARRAANYLYQARWQTGTGVGMEEALEIFRLGMEAREQGIAAEVGGKIARSLLNDPERFMPALSLSLEAMVGEEEWLFDRKLFEE